LLLLLTRDRFDVSDRAGVVAGTAAGPRSRGGAGREQLGFAGHDRLVTVG
jgi:hypothetical protein